MELNWYAVYTKPRWEKKVACTLSKFNISNYCPLNRVVRQWSDRKKMIEEPLFTSYVFVQINPKQQSQLRQIDGIVNFVYWLGKPAVIRNDEIETIKSFLSEHQNVKLEKSRINLKDSIRIIQGPFMDMEGKVIALNSKSIKVVLPTLGFVMIAEIKRDDVELLVQSKVQQALRRMN